MLDWQLCQICYPLEIKLLLLLLLLFSKHFRNLVACRIDVLLQVVSVLGNFRTVHRDVIRHWSSYASTLKSGET